MRTFIHTISTKTHYTYKHTHKHTYTYRRDLASNKKLSREFVSSQTTAKSHTCIQELQISRACQNSLGMCCVSVSLFFAFCTHVCECIYLGSGTADCESLSNFIRYALCVTYYCVCVCLFVRVPFFCCVHMYVCVYIYLCSGALQILRACQNLLGHI
jgi:hypothetical protein